jgi:hypothetical protein
MRDHLAAGCSGNAEIAIQEKVAQTTGFKLGVFFCHVGKFRDIRMRIHPRPPSVGALGFNGALVGPQVAVCCYAKFAPDCGGVVLDGCDRVVRG